MILVVGGTGRLGSLVVRDLVDQGVPVRVLTRDPVRAATLLPGVVEVRAGDLRDPASLAPAIAGAGLVLCAAHGVGGPRGQSPATVDRDGNAHLVDAAKGEGAEVVLMSVVGARPDSPMELFRMKHAAEQHLWASGVAATVVRAAAFLEMWIDVLTQTAGRSGRPLVFGRGENPINMVSIVDVAALVELSLAERSLRGSTVEIGGPENLTFNQIARAVAASAGSDRPPRHVPRPALRVLAAAAGVLKPDLGRQASMAITMDTTDLTFDSTAVRQKFPDLPCTSLEEALARRRVAR